jgi:hypothetical protein
MPLGVSPVINPPGNSDVRVVVVDNMVVVAGVENVVIDVAVDVEGVLLISVMVIVAGVEVVTRRLEATVLHPVNPVNTTIQDT